MFKFQPTAIVWDLDGTLVDSAPDLASALNTILDKRGFFTLSLNEVRAMIGNGVPKLVERGFNAVGIRPDPAQLDELISMFVKEYKACATDNTRPYPGVVEALQAIHAMSIPMGVCTTNRKPLPVRYLTALASPVFSAVWLVVIPPAHENLIRNPCWPVSEAWSQIRHRA